MYNKWNAAVSKLLTLECGEKDWDIICKFRVALLYNWLHSSIMYILRNISSFWTREISTGKVYLISSKYLKSSDFEFLSVYREVTGIIKLMHIMSSMLSCVWTNKVAKTQTVNILSWFLLCYKHLWYNDSWFQLFGTVQITI